MKWNNQVPMQCLSSNDSRLHVVELPRGRSFIWQIRVNSSIQDHRQVDRGFYGVKSVVRGNADSLLTQLSPSRWCAPQPRTVKVPLLGLLQKTSLAKVPATCVQDVCIGYIQDGYICTTCVTPPRPHTPSPPPSPAHHVRQVVQTYYIVTQMVSATNRRN